MSTTIRRNALLLGAVLLAWGAMLLAMPFVGPSGRQVAVIGGEARSLAAIRAAGGRVVELRDGAVIARSDRPGFAWALYRAGARLVLEGRIGAGCFRKR